MKTVTVRDIKIAQNLPFTLIAGPCQLESLEHARMMATGIAEACAAAGINWVFKASYDKANRSSLSGQRGVGMDKGLEILGTIGQEFNVPTITDVHEPWHCAKAAEVVDILQIPAFLCRQTDLLLAAGETGKAINVKKGQFLAPWDMGNAVKKIESTGNENIMLCERGTTFGYGQLVTDMRSLPIMAATGYPTVFDATHSVQMPGSKGTSTGGQREFVEPLARAAIAIGTGAVFIETHEDPDNAPSDGPNMVPLAEMTALLKRLKAYDDITKG
ncbi:3-deoxy-8-phosphooctulonate synthase [Donghicola tyrosinivorans]|uniref:2-dehydro-3-deoxyphosphooctonate aldolase n=1 Tax=Donghicola tyrosinivorans TaxID=1652492 RepID=A0A2T0WXT9_9RHOB|nr:3-deoxy-8-phosphooctulonate synthase [Donghicola tyrosinivorans]PRY91491.1 2-dehydro-3-deoxyphosphooctonate aldolase (KDO 8-P synthase) [Donghicola tyrosinivorans]